MFLSTDIRVNQVFSALFIVIGGALYLFHRSAADYALVSDLDGKDQRKSKPGKFKVKKITPATVSPEESKPNDFKAMTDELRKQRENESKENK